MTDQNNLLGTEIQPDYIPTQDERTLAILSHILTLVAPLLAPLIIYLIKKDESKYVEWHAKESLNFQITLIIGYIVGFLTIIIIVGIVILALLGLIGLILVIVATVRASENKLYRYPFNIRIIK